MISQIDVADGGAISASVSRSEEDAALAAVISWRERNDQSAARWIVDRVTPLARNIALRRLPRAWMVDDAVQGTLASLFGTIDRVDAHVSLAAWTVGLAKNVCGNMLRSWRRRLVFPLAEMGVDELQRVERGATSICPYKTAAAREELDRVARQIDRMRGIDRLVASLFFEEDAPAAAIARQTGLSLGAARVRVHRMRLALRKN